jgi:hypothetical protein
VTWVLVVAAVVALAIAVHFYEKAQAWARAARKRARLHSDRHGLHEASIVREIRETWDADFRTMRLRVGRTDDAAPAAQPLSYALEREAVGVWVMRPATESAEASKAVHVPLGVAEKLEARYQRFLEQSGKDAAPGRPVQ